MEEWRNIVGFDGYQVSSIGRIKSFRGDKIKGKIIKSFPNKKGYLRVLLNCNNGQKMRRVHRLVAEAFIPNKKEKPQVDHIDAVKSNNRVENLRWCTNDENARFRFGKDAGIRFEENPKTWYLTWFEKDIRYHVGAFETIEKAREAKIDVENNGLGVISKYRKYKKELNF